MITAERMAAVDENAEALGVARKQLMESSGNAVARVVREHAEPDDRITIVAGRGNNGGDAFGAARFLDGFDLSIRLLGRPETITTGISRENWEALVAAGYETETVTDSKDFSLPSPEVVVDAMLGTGVTGELREPEATAAREINASEATVVSVDVPSGVDANTGESPGTAVEADHVVTFHDTKPGLANLDCEVTVADIGIPEAAERFVGPGDLRGIGRASDSHKGQNGDVLVIGGGPFAGAPALSAGAVLKAGGDLANVLCPDRVFEAVQGYGPDLIVHDLAGKRFAPEHVEEALSRAEEKDCVVLGPGLGSAEETLDAIGEFLAGFEGLGVIDADALQVVPEVETDSTLICTPHKGEFERMGGERADDPDEQAELAREFAAEVDHVMLVKGPTDVVSDGERVRISRSGNPGMTVGGTGDVLAGITAAFSAPLEPFEAAAAAAYVNGLAGDAAYSEDGLGLTASRMLEHIPAAMGGAVDE
ncbi:NAD(P)H-hydrate dehydratase [Natronorarus salvus]|uniref:NAD(P)H-hydrate dehydratase n=1 Tax=Natronorarus salvus TaxID=3117733 RepID=UPI002F25EF0B